MTARIELEALLAETRWLGGLARRLVADGADADDLVQDTLRAAVEAAPRADGSIRGWLRTTLVRRWRDAARARRAREDRERACASRRTAPSAAELVVKAELQHELVGAVLALDEPYRACLLMRFFEDLPPREIAARTGVPVATVNSRLQRALARVRGRLEREHGPEWALALAPFLPDRSLTPLFVGASLVNVIPKLFVAAVAIAIALLAWNWSTDPAVHAPGAAAAAAQPTRASARDGAVTDVVAAARTDAEPADGARGAAGDDEPDDVLLRGRVLDVQGVAIAGVQLSVGGGGEARPVSATDGGFEFPRSAASDRVVAADRRWSTVLAGSSRIQPERECVVVVAPRVDLGGRVVDAHGAPLPGAAVQVHLPAHLGADLGVLLDYSLAVTWRTTCDDDGRFDLQDVPAVAAGTLSASIGGYLPQLVDVPRASTALLEFRLERAEAGAGVVAGIVLDRFGAAVRGALVSDGREVSRSDERGAFRVDVADRPGLRRLVAVAPGMQPAVYEPPSGDDGEPAWPPRVILRLGEPPRSLAGRVVDAAGAPVVGARVWVADPMLVGHDGDAVLAETLLGGGPKRFWAYVETGADGAFTIGGLLDRAYELRALEPTTLAAATRAEVSAGSDGVELRLDAPVHDELRGRVVARDGTPIPGVTVKVQRPALEVRVPGGTRDTWASGAEQLTDERGAFRFERVPTEGVEVFALGDAIQFAGRAVAAGIDPTAFDVVVDRRVHLQVEVAAPFDRVDRVRVLDAGGKAMLLRVMRGQSAHTNRSAAVVDGRTEVLSLGEGAREVVLLRDGEEVGRLPVQLRVGDVNRVRY